MYDLVKAKVTIHPVLNGIVPILNIACRSPNKILRESHFVPVFLSRVPVCVLFFL